MPLRCTIVGAIGRGVSRLAFVLAVSICVVALSAGGRFAEARPLTLEELQSGTWKLPGMTGMPQATSITITAGGGGGPGPEEALEGHEWEPPTLTGRYVRDGNIECLTYSDGSEMCANIPPGETESMAGRSARTGSAEIRIEGDEAVRLL